MDTPSSSCRKGNHVASEVEPGVVRCAWCGLVARVQSRHQDATSAVVSTTEDARAPRGDSVVTETLNTPADASGHNEAIADIENRFRRMAREYVSGSAALIQWIKAGNVLPHCYR